MIAALALLGACGDRPVAAPALATAQIATLAPAPSVVVPIMTPALPPSATPTSAPAPLPTEPAPTSAPEQPSPAPAPPAGTPAAPSGDPAAQEARLVEAINQLRAANGLAPYEPVPELAEVARGHSCDLAAHTLISHTSSDGRTLQDRLGERAARWAWPSESIAAGTDDPAQVVAMWLDEPPDGWHRRNMLDTEQQAIGAGYCAAPDDPSGNRFYWTIVVARHSQ